MHHIRTTRQSVTLTEPQFTYLKAEAERLGISVSDLIRRIVDRHRDSPQARGRASSLLTEDELRDVFADGEVQKARSGTPVISYVTEP